MVQQGPDPIQLPVLDRCARVLREQPRRPVTSEATATNRIC
ncbi:hypothetical protein ACN6LM_002405 [Streptomyces sp. SAS_281]